MSALTLFVCGDALDGLDGYPADGPERALAAQLIARALRGEGDAHAN